MTSRTYLCCQPCFSSNSYNRPAPGTAHCLWSSWCQGLTATHRNSKKVNDNIHQFPDDLLKIKAAVVGLNTSSCSVNAGCGKLLCMSCSIHEKVAELLYVLTLTLVVWSLVPCPSDLMLDILVKEGLISEYTFLFIPETTSDLQGSKQVIHMCWDLTVE